jgi:hypothetical protein
VIVEVVLKIKRHKSNEESNPGLPVLFFGHATSQLAVLILMIRLGTLKVNNQKRKTSVVLFYILPADWISAMESLKSK